MGLVNTLIFAIQPDTVDYGEWKTGIRGEGSAYSVLSFTRKVGQGVGGAAASFTIGLGATSPARRPRPARRSPRSRWPSASSPPWPS
jgi:glucuronide carrier protein